VAACGERDQPAEAPIIHSDRSVYKGLASENEQALPRVGARCCWWAAAGSVLLASLGVARFPTLSEVTGAPPLKTAKAGGGIGAQTAHQPGARGRTGYDRGKIDFCVFFFAANNTGRSRPAEAFSKSLGRQPPGNIHRKDKEGTIPFLPTSLSLNTRGRKTKRNSR